MVQFSQHFEGGVRAAVIYINDLEVEGHLLEHTYQSLMSLRHNRFFILTRDNDRKQ
jgi:hypothetical protein